MSTVTAKTLTVSGVKLNMMEYLYTGYDPSKPVPVIIEFPGAGEVGTNPSVLPNAGMFSVLKTGVDVGVNVIALEIQNQNPNPRPSEIQAYITAIKALYNISAIILTGYSRGGQDIDWFVGNAESEMAELAAIFEISSEGPVADVAGIPGAWEPQWFVQSGVQWWGVCGDQDSFYNSNQYSMLPRYNALKAVAPNQAFFTVIPGQGHSGAVWNTAFTPGAIKNAAGQDFWHWAASFGGSVVVAPPPPPPPPVPAPTATLIPPATTAQIQAIVNPQIGWSYTNTDTGKVTTWTGKVWN